MTLLNDTKNHQILYIFNRNKDENVHSYEARGKFFNFWRKKIGIERERKKEKERETEGKKRKTEKKRERQGQRERVYVC